jgi:hypothetical protein
MVITLVTIAPMVTVLPRYWCFYDCCGTMVAIVIKLPVVPFATVFTDVSGVHWWVGLGLSARSFSLSGHKLSRNFQHLYRPDSHLNTSR